MCLLTRVTLVPFVRTDMLRSLHLRGVTCSILTLEIMPWIAMFFVPISVLYTSGCYVRV